MNLTKKLITVAALTVVAGAANADAFYIDNGVSNGGVGVHAAGSTTTTGVINSLLDNYNSKTNITDTNGNGILDTGDKVLGTGGLLKASGLLSSAIGENIVTNFSPTPGGIADPSGPAANGYGSAWSLSLGYNNLQGTYNSAGGITYTSGTIHIYYIDATHPAASQFNVLNFNVTGGGNNSIGQSLNLIGTVSVVNGGTALGSTTVANLFHWAADGSSFNSSPTSLTLFQANQNSDPFYVNGVDTLGAPINVNTFFSSKGGVGTLEATHDGSVTFGRTGSSVPEPASLALIGLGLVGISVSRRRTVKM